jgi:hypothetical protein
MPDYFNIIRGRSGDGNGRITVLSGVVIKRGWGNFEKSLFGPGKIGKTLHGKISELAPGGLHGRGTALEDAPGRGA